DILGNRVYQMSPTDGTIISSFLAGGDPLGVAWDGAGLWVSDLASGALVRYNPDGTPTGQQFTVQFSGEVGGLAFDTTDGTLWVGATSRIYHYSTNGTEIGSFDIPVADGR